MPPLLGLEESESHVPVLTVVDADEGVAVGHQDAVGVLPTVTHGAAVERLDPGNGRISHGKGDTDGVVGVVLAVDALLILTEAKHLAVLHDVFGLESELEQGNLVLLDTLNLLDADHLGSPGALCPYPTHLRSEADLFGSVHEVWYCPDSFEPRC